MIYNIYSAHNDLSLECEFIITNIIIVIVFAAVGYTY